MNCRRKFREIVRALGPRNYENVQNAKFVQKFIHTSTCSFSFCVCDYCEVLCEILIFGYHISVISYFLDGVNGLEHNNLF